MGGQDSSEGQGTRGREGLGSAGAGDAPRVESPETQLDVPAQSTLMGSVHGPAPGHIPRPIA